MRGITWRGQRCANAKSIDHRSLRYQLFDAVFIQIAGRKYLDVLPSHTIEFTPYPTAVFRQVTAIQSNTGWLASHFENCLQGSAHIVCVKKKNGVSGKGVKEVSEGFSFVFVGHNPGMCLGSICVHAKFLPGENIGCAFTSSDGSGTSGKKAGLATVRAPRSEFDYLPALGRGDNSRCLARDHGLITQGGQQISFHDLAFNDGCGHAQERFAGERQASFGHSPDLHSELKCREIIEKFVPDIAKHGVLAEESNLIGRKMNVFQKIQGLFESSGYQKISLGRKVADKKLERGRGVKAGLQIPRRHRQFIEIG